MPAQPCRQIVEEAVQALTSLVGHRAVSGITYHKAAEWTVHALHLWPAVVAEVWMSLDTASYPGPKSVMWVLMQRFVSPTTSEDATFWKEAPTEAYLRLQWIPKAQAIHQKAVAATNQGLVLDLAANMEARSAWQKKADKYVAQQERRSVKLQRVWAEARAKSKARDKSKVPRPEINYSSEDESAPSEAEEHDDQKDGCQACLLTSSAALAAGVPAWHNPQSDVPGGVHFQAPPGPDVHAAMACLARDLAWLKGAAHPGPPKYVVVQQSQESGQAFLPIKLLPLGPPPGYRLTEVSSMGLVCGFRIHGMTPDLRHLPGRQQQVNSWPASTTSAPTLSCMDVAYKCRPGSISLVARTLMLRAMWQDYDIACGRWPVDALAATEWRSSQKLPMRPSKPDIVHYDGGWDTGGGGLHCEQYVPDPACDSAACIPFHDQHLNEAWMKARQAV